jgi:hypothetical protein
MKIKNLICGALAVGAMFAVNPGVSHAEYLTAFEDVRYEKYVVDTDSFFYPEKNDKYHQFNCIVWKYTSSEDKGTPYTFRFKYENNKWFIAERKKGKEDLVWVEVENKSIASDVLRVSLPYIGHTVIEKNR